MLGRLSSYLRQRTRARHLARYAIADTLWQQTVGRLPFLRYLDGAQLAELRELTTLFIAEKEFSTAHDMPLTDEMVVSVATQASLPVLRLGLECYRGWHGIVLYPGEFLIRKTVVDEIGLVHGVEEEASGEAWEDGPVILSWPDAAQEVASPLPYNVVIHEFAHKLDMLNGEPDGIPGFSRERHGDLDVRLWQAGFEAAYAAFCTQVDAIDILDDESAEIALTALLIDSYGASDPAEFFAVSSESFFVQGTRFKEAYPALYKLLAAYYLQQP
jgi:Mlc titration factor MtfA (ptsG expression regulator)